MPVNPQKGSKKLRTKYFLPYYAKDDDEKADQSCQKKGHQVHLKETHLKEYQANFIYKVSGDKQ